MELKTLLLCCVFAAVTYCSPIFAMDPNFPLLTGWNSDDEAYSSDDSGDHEDEPTPYPHRDRLPHADTPDRARSPFPGEDPDAQALQTQLEHLRRQRDAVRTETSALGLQIAAQDATIQAAQAEQAQLQLQIAQTQAYTQAMQAYMAEALAAVLQAQRNNQ